MRILLFIVCFFSALPQQAQQLLFNNMNMGTPLPSQECYNILQDQKGYIWFSTEAGLCRYNGSSLKIYDHKNGLPEKATYCLTEDKNGTLWMATKNGRIVTCKNGVLKEASFSKTYHETIKGDFEITYLLTPTPDNGLFMSSGGRTFKADKNGKLTEIPIPDTNVNFYLEHTGNGLVPINGFSRMSQPDRWKKVQKGLVSIKVAYKNEIREIQLPYSKTRHPYWRLLVSHHGETDFFSFENILIRMNPDRTHDVFTFPDRVFQLYCDRNNGLWVGLRKSGVYYYPNVRNMENHIESLKEYSVTGICEDHEKGIWCTTIENGVFYCRNKAVRSYAYVPGLDHRASILYQADGKVMVSSHDNELVVISNDQIITHRFPGPERYELTDVYPLPDGWIVSSRLSMFRTNADFGMRVRLMLDNTNIFAGSYQVVGIPGNRLISLQYRSTGELINDRLYVRNIIGFPSPGKVLFYWNGKLFCGCTTGLITIDPDKYTAQKIEGINGEVIKMVAVNQSELWIVTREQGLFIYKNSKVYDYTKKLQLENLRLFDICKDRLGNIWLATNKGLKKIVSQNDRFLYYTYNAYNGLPSNEIYKVATDDRYVYCSGNEGLCSFALETDLSNSIRPLVYRTSLLVDNIPWTQAGMTFPYDRNSIQVNFDVLSFKGQQVKLRYSLKGGNSPVPVNKGNSIYLANLQPGEYDLLVQAVNNDGLTSDPIMTSFTILPPFWQTSWFMALVVVAVIALVYGLVKIIARRIRKKEEEKTRINKLISEYQLSALQAQMNPHFIFNAINSIQGYILRKDAQQAYDYLAKFSKLVRMVLNNSQEKTLPLVQEIEMIKIYVELEQLRFDQRFEFTLTVDEMVDQHETYIPGMLIQPYIENAIWHGLMNMKKDRKAKLDIVVNMQGESLKVIIEDNGIGRDAAQSLKKTGHHQSVGMKLTEKRLSTLYQLKEFERSDVIITDLHHNGTPAGTRVEIIIPSN